jgi:hypothetical protein
MAVLLSDCGIQHTPAHTELSRNTDPMLIRYHAQSPESLGESPSHPP